MYLLVKPSKKPNTSAYSHTVSSLTEKQRANRIKNISKYYLSLEEKKYNFQPQK